MSTDITQYTLPNNQPIVALDSSTVFNALAPNEKLYAHYLSQAAWYGSLIVLVQTSPESPLIFALIHHILANEPIANLRKASIASGVAEDEFTAFLVYVSGFLSNVGNYQSFGNTKIIPNLPKEKFKTIVKSSKVYKTKPQEIEDILIKICDSVYSLDEHEHIKSLGLGDEGITTYFSANSTVADAKIVNEFMKNKSRESYNTRCFKTTETYEDSGVKKVRNVYDIKLASVEKSDHPAITLPEEIFKDSKFKITRGDYANLLGAVVENLGKARKYAANDNERSMLDKYVSHFRTGSLKDHKDASRFWVRDKAPVVESYIGFSHTYRDPTGQRGEFSGFVAMVNKEKSGKFATLVSKGNELLTKLPWGSEFENDQFITPDFTYLDVLTFAGSQIPAGINAPSYEDVREEEGFKNVYLGNVLSAIMKQNVFPFLTEKDQELMNKYRISSFDVNVGLHELLGHGSGKLFRKLASGKFNFDQSKVKNPLTNGLIEKYFLDGETYVSKFGALAASYEECRAEAIELYLSLEKDVLKIFGYEGQEAEDVIYVNWLSILWSGFAVSLEWYQPSTKKWLQAHSQASYALLRVCIEAGEDFVKIEEIEPGKNLKMTLDRSKIATVGKRAVGEFLKKLQVYQSTGDFEAASAMYDRYTEVPESGPQPWANWRNIVLAHKQPSEIFVQSNTFVNDSDAGKVTLKNYEPTFDGFIQSWVDRFPSSEIPNKLIELWNENQRYFAPHQESKLLPDSLEYTNVISESKSRENPPDEAKAARSRFQLKELLRYSIHTALNIFYFST